MHYLVFALLALGIIAALFGFLSRHDNDEIVVAEGDCTTCDGNNSKCEQKCMMEASVKPIEYYDDEELDAFRGRASDSYSDEEIEQFSDVLYTMRQDEVAAWLRSLRLREVSLPDALKDEVALLVDQSKK